jgi:tripeptidyl-peptidase I
VLSQCSVLLEHSINSEIHSSDPKSSRFGNHYTVNEVTDLFAPSTMTVEVVKSWIVNSGIREERISQSSNKAWLQFDASIEEMEQLLQTKYHYYEHVSGGPKHIGCENYKVPVALSDHIDYVTPGVKPLATRAIGDIMKRDLALLNSRGQVRKPIPADVLAKIEENIGTFCQS